MKARTMTANLHFAAASTLGALETSRDRMNHALDCGDHPTAHEHAMRVSGAANRLACITLALSHLDGHDDNPCPFADDRCPLHPYWTV